MTPKRLFGQMNWAELKVDVDAALKANPSWKFIGAYSRVLMDAWNAASPEVRAQCTVEAKKLNDGEGSIASKALFVYFSRYIAPLLTTVTSVQVWGLLFPQFLRYSDYFGREVVRCDSDYDHSEAECKG